MASTGIQPGAPFMYVPAGGGGGSGTVTNVSVATANGVSGTVSNPTTTPAITLSLGAITPTTVNGVAIPNLVNYEGTGLRNGCTISINADTTKFDISAGTMFFVDNTTVPATPTFAKLDYAGSTANVVTNIATQNATFIGIDNTGTIIQQSTSFTPAQRRSIVQLGAVIHSNRVNINVVDNLPAVAIDLICQQDDLMMALKQFNVSGNIMSANGANLNINKSGGSMFKTGSNFATDPKNPHITTNVSLTAPATIRYRLQNGTEYANTAVIDPANYDNAGVLSAVGGSSWTVQRICLFTSNLIRIQYGQQTYGTKAAAISDISTQIFNTEANIAENGLLRGLLVVIGNASDLSNTNQAVFLEVGKFGEVQASSTSGGTTTLQQAYDNSTVPQILTSTTGGALTVKRGSGADTDHVYDIMNGAGNIVAYIDGLGNVVGRTTPKLYHGVLSRTTVAPLPTNTTTTTFTITTGTTPLTYYRNGVKTVVNTNKSVTHTGTAGVKFLYFTDDAGTITAYDTFQGLDGTIVLLATINWNGSDYGIVNDERHSYDRDVAWHEWAHNTIGARYGSGLGFSFAGTTIANTTFAVTSGNIYDEDINFAISGQTQARIWYQTGATTYAFDKVLSTTPYKQNGTGIQAVNIAGYGLVTITASNRFFNYFVYGTTSNIAPIHIFCETTATTGGYTSVANARAVATPSLNGFNLSPEYKLLYRVVVNGVGLVQALITSDDYRTTSSVSGGSVPSSTASSVSETNYGNVQTAINTIISRTLTVNGTTQDLTADRTWTVTDANLSVSDITTNNASASAHGFLPKLDNTGTKYLRDDGTWQAVSGGSLSWGASATGTSGTGLLLTVGNSASAGAIGQSIVIGDTQTNVVTALSIDTGISAINNIGIDIKALINRGISVNYYSGATQAIGTAYGIRIGGQFNTNSTFQARHIDIQNYNNAGTGYNTGLYIGNLSTELTIGAGGSGVYISQSGVGGTGIHIYGGSNVNSSTNGIANYTLDNTQSGASVVQKIDLGTSSQGHTGLLVNAFGASATQTGVKIDMSSTNAGYGLIITSAAADGTLASFRGSSANNNLEVKINSTNQTVGLIFQPLSSNLGSNVTGLMQASFTSSNGSGVSVLTSNITSTVNAAITNLPYTLFYGRTCGNVTQSETYNTAHIKRTSVTNNAGAAYTAAGSVLKLENIRTQTSGTLTDSTDVLILTQDANSTGYLINGGTGNFQVSGKGRIATRVTTVTSSATPTPDGDASDLYTVTELAAGATFGAPTGTPINGQILTIRIKDNGSAKTLAWNAIYRASTDLALPTTTVISKTLYLEFIYNSADSKWDLILLLNNF